MARLHLPVGIKVAPPGGHFKNFWYTFSVVRAIISDVSYVLLFPKDKSYSGLLNDLYEKLRTASDFSFQNYFEINSELLNYFDSIKGKVSLYIYTSDYIQNDPAVKSSLDNTFKKIYSAREMGTHKSRPEGYQQIIYEIGLPAKEALFIDDNPSNLEVAKLVGLETILYKNNQETIEAIKKV